MFYVVFLWWFAALPVNARSLQLLAFIATQPGTDGTLAPTDKISLASIIQAVFLIAGYSTGEEVLVRNQTGFIVTSLSSSLKHLFVTDLITCRFFLYFFLTFHFFLT